MSLGRLPHRVQSLTPFLATRDLAATIAFYTEQLGFRVDVLHPPEAPTFVTLDWRDPAGGEPRATIIFDSTCWQADPVMTGQLLMDLGDDRGGRSTVLEMYERLRSRVRVEWGPEVYDYGRREFSFKDPNGYSLVLSERTEAAPTCGG